MDEPRRFYGTDTTLEFDTICELTVMDDGTYRAEFVILPRD